MKAIALTDKGNVYGLIDHYKACKENGIKPILGCEVFMAFRSRFDKEPGIDNQRFQLILLAKNMTGYENLLKLSSEGFLTGMYYRPRVDMELLREYSEGILAILPRVNSEVSFHLVNGNEKEAEKALQKYQSIFGKDVYLEMLFRPKYESDELLTKGIHELSQKTGVPLVATNDVYYVEEDDAEAHDTLLCLQYNQIKNDPNRFRLTEHNLSFVTGEEMEKWFSEFPEALINTKKIAEECSIEFEFGVHRLPNFPIPEGYSSPKEYLRFLCEKGISRRYHFEKEAEKKASQISQDEVLKRMNFELDIIGTMGFDSYFLIVHDFVGWAKSHGIAVGPGRGSAAGSIVAYLLEITDLDPLTYDLLFERFLNPERISLPDIDLDFADDRRDEVIEYVREKYGRDHVAQICTFGTMAARAAVKDVGRVMGLPFQEMNEFGKLIPERPGTTLEEAEKKSPELALKLQNDEIARQVYENAKKFEGNVRHISVHACAVVIAPEPILKFTAVQHPPKDDNTIITQYSAKPLDALGLLKMDFLGLRNLTILERAKFILFKTKKLDLSLSQIPMDDKETFKLLSDGSTTGVFQMESAGMTRYLKELKPTHFEDIIAMGSLYRPGPMQFIPDYIKGKHGKADIRYPHISLEKILKPTYGIAIYQEQILQIAQVFAGFSLGQADILRRAIGKKIPEELASQRQKFIDGAKKLGHDEKLAMKIFDEVVEPFAGYGFNRSHAAGYALITYQTAYLKAHYPTEFFAALLSCDKENTDRVILDIEEARHFGITVLPPDITESNADFTVTKSKEIRFGLMAVKGVGQGVVEEIIKARESEPFANFADFLSRVSPKAINKKSIESLAKAGAFSQFLDPKEIIENLEEILRFAKQESQPRDENQHTLFSGESLEKKELRLPRTAHAKFSERLKWEKEVLGIYVSSHPLQGMRRFFETKGVPISTIPNSVRYGKNKITLHGLCTNIRKLITKKNEVMAIVTIEDLTGKVEAVLFPKSYAGFQIFLEEDSFMFLTGKAEKRNGEWQIVVDSLTSKELEKVRNEAEKEGFLDENEEFFSTKSVENIPEMFLSESEPGSEETVSFPEEESPDENIKIEEKWQQTEENSPSELPFRIPLPDAFSREKMKKLNQLLSEYKGDQEVELLFQNHTLLFPERVSVGTTLKKKIEELFQE